MSDHDKPFGKNDIPLLDKCRPEDLKKPEAFIPEESEGEQKSRFYESPLDKLIPENEDAVVAAPVVGKFRLTKELLTTRMTPVFIGQTGFDLIRPDGVIAMYGKRRSGKTYYADSLCFFLSSLFPYACCFTTTKDSGEWTMRLPEYCVKQGLVKNIDHLIQLIDRQKKLKCMVNMGLFKPTPQQPNIRLLLIFDDVLTENLRHIKELEELFFNGRHWDICVLILMQDLKGITPAMTGNTDHIICFQARSERDKETIRTKYADFFRNDNEFTEVASVVLDEKYNALMIMQDNPNLPECVSFYEGKAPEHPEYVLGCREMWRGCEKQLERLGMGHLAAMNVWPIGDEHYLRMVEENRPPDSDDISEGKRCMEVYKKWKEQYGPTVIKNHFL